MHEKITIERLAYGDAAIGRAESGKTVFVNGACPGDEAIVEITADKGNYLEGQVSEIIAPSPFRVTPVCPFANECGGCGWQHVAYEQQLVAKRENVVSQLARIGGFGTERAEQLVANCVPSKRQMGYRNKIEFSCNMDPVKGFQMGFNRKGSNDIVEPQVCPLAHKAIEKTACETIAAADPV